MPTYLIIEERDADGELVSYAKYDITEPRATSLIPLPEPKTALRLAWIDDLPYYFRRTCDEYRWLEADAELGAKSVPHKGSKAS